MRGAGRRFIPKTGATIAETNAPVEPTRSPDGAKTRHFVMPSAAGKTLRVTDMPNPVATGNLKLWADALRRSEEFPPYLNQGIWLSSQFRHGNLWGPLGVACELYRRATGRGRWWRTWFMEHNDSLPPAVLAWLEIPPQFNTLIGEVYEGISVGSKMDSIANLIEFGWSGGPGNSKDYRVSGGCTP